MKITDILLVATLLVGSVLTFIFLITKNDEETKKVVVYYDGEVIDEITDMYDNKIYIYDGDLGDVVVEIKDGKATGE